MNNNRLIKAVVTGMTSGKKKRVRQGQIGYLTSKNDVMGVSLTLTENASSWHQRILSHEDLRRRPTLQYNLIHVIIFLVTLGT